MFEDFKRERTIKNSLRKLAKQRVVLIGPSNEWVIEKALITTPDIRAALRTCHLRGWADVVENSIPHGTLQADGSLPEGPMFDRREPVYRLTDSGWSIVNRAREWFYLNVVISIVALELAYFALK